MLSWQHGLRFCLGVLALSLPLLGQGQTVTDDRGVSVSFDHAPQRIVSLLPALTETVCALGRCQRLVGVDRYSNFPAEVQRLPKLGGGLDPSIEAIVALRPDLVLIAKSSRAVERLQGLGFKVLAMEPQTQADVQRVWLTLGQLLAVPEAPKIWQQMDAEVSAAAQTVPASVKGLRVYFEVNQGPYAAGEASFIGQTLSRLGVENTVPARMGPFPKLNPEFVVRANPDLILMGEGNANALLQRPGWSLIGALRTHRICLFTPAQADVLVRPGPRMGEAARLMAECLVKVERPAP